MIQFLTKNNKIDRRKSMLIQSQEFVFPQTVLQYWKVLVYYLSFIYLPFPSSEE